MLVVLLRFACSCWHLGAHDEVWRPDISSSVLDRGCEEEVHVAAARSTMGQPTDATSTTTFQPSAKPRTCERAVQHCSALDPWRRESAVGMGVDLPLARGCGVCCKP